jgi:hypothetical protein
MSDLFEVDYGENEEFDAFTGQPIVASNVVERVVERSARCVCARKF